MKKMSTNQKSWLRTCFLPILLLIFSYSVSAQSNAPITGGWVTDGTVFSFANDPVNHILYAGGSFNNIYLPHSRAAVVNPSTANVVQTFPMPDGDVYASIPDGSGGVYIGGDFTQLGGVSRTRLAHVNADGQVTSLNVAADYTVRSLYLSGSTLYVGGSFSNIGGQARSCLAAINLNTGAVKPWNPNVAGTVYSIAVVGSTVYIGGSFSVVGGQTHICAAAIDAVTGIPTSWSPVADNNVTSVMTDAANGKLYLNGGFNSISKAALFGAACNLATGAADLNYLSPDSYVQTAISDGNGGWYIGGDFTQVGGQIRNHLAQIDASGQLTSWNPDASGSVRSLCLDNGILYVGGFFSTIGGQSRSQLAAISTSTGLATSWNPGADGLVSSIKVVGNIVYVGGSFSTTGGQSRNRVAAINATTGLATSWNPNISGSGNEVRAIIVSGGIVYVGGSFNNVGGQTRNKLAAIDKVTGIVTSWDPNVSGNIETLAISGNLIFAGGNFSQVNGQPRDNIAAIDLSTGVPNSWAPNPDGSVYSLSVSAGMVYVGGDFKIIAGQSRNYVAAVDESTGSATSWNPSANKTIHTIALNNTTAYLGGELSGISAQFRKGIAAFDIPSGTLSSWDPNPNSPVKSIALDNNKIYLAGFYTSIGGQSRNGLAAYDLASGNITSWNPGYGGVNSICLIGNKLYTNGASFDASNGTTSVWDLGLINGELSTMAAYGNAVFVGGYFSGINKKVRGNLAAFDLVTDMPTPLNPGTDNTIRTIALEGNTLYIGGSFSIVNGELRSRIAAVDKSTGAVTSWDPGANSTVRALTSKDNIVYVGGSFTSIGGQSRNRLAAIDAVTGLATAWNPGADGPVYSLLSIGNLLYTGGYFTSIDGQPRNRIAAFDISTGSITAWNPSADNGVTMLASGGTKIYAVGDFSSIGGQSRDRLAALNVNTGLATTWNPSSGGVTSILAVGSKVYVGGFFTSIAGQSRSGIACLDATTGSVNTWNPYPNNGVVRTFAVNGTKLIVGGDFTTFTPPGSSSTARRSLAFFDNCIVAPKKPGAVTQTGGGTKVCPGETRVYTVDPADGAISYEWAVPTGATIASGQGTTSIEVSFDSSYPASDTIKVKAVNGCGNSGERFKVVSKGTAPSTPSAITGENYGLCTQLAVAYSVINVPDLTYNWSFSNANGTVTTGQGTNAITADYSPGAATSVLSVTGANGCGTSAARTKTIYAKPTTPSSITGSAAVCAHATGVAYSTPVVSGASTYTWKAPAGSHLSDGLTTSTGTSLTTTSNSVTVNFGASAGNVQVKANNACASSGFFLYPVTMNCRMINGAEQPMVSDEVSVYPNPAKNHVTVKFSTETAGEYTIHVYDVIGKEVMTTNGSTSIGINQVDLNTSLLASGVYHLVLTSSGVDYNTKLVLDK